MADIELVIKIPESTYKVFKNLSKIIGVLVYEKDIITLIKAVKNGTPLPKGHGRLIDADERRTEIDEADRWVVDLAQTIIEADKTESEE